MSGYPDTGSIRRGAELYGFPAAGLPAQVAMFTSPDTGVNFLHRRAVQGDVCGFP
jgi:hypothetical protein